MRNWLFLILLMLAIPASVLATIDDTYEPVPIGGVLVEEKTAEQLEVMLASGALTSVSLTRAYLDRIAALDPTLNAVIAVSPNALEQAAASDARRQSGKILGALDGIPVLIKDNIETIELPTTAGSLALKDNMSRRDATVVAMIREQGAVILGKTNLTEWAAARSSIVMLGWSAVGGLTRNPYAFDRSPCGSSSGSAVAVAASFAPLAVGTETNGSVTCPSSVNGLVGLKPTYGLVSRTHLIPVIPSQDTPGPIAKTVKDVAILFNAMVSVDAQRDRHDFTATLSTAALEGKRIGYWKPEMPAALSTTFDAALDQLRRAGATLVEVQMPNLNGLEETRRLIFYTEFKAYLTDYLMKTPSSVKTRTFADLIAFNEANKTSEMRFFGQDLFLETQNANGLDDAEYLGALAKARRLTGKDGIDAMLKAADVELLVTPTSGMAWLSDPIYGDRPIGPRGSDLPAVSGYPHLTVPMGMVDGLPVGLSFIGTAFSDQLLLEAGFAYEYQAKARVEPKYLPTVEAGFQK